jgi:hypothetical protein
MEGGVVVISSGTPTNISELAACYLRAVERFRLQAQLSNNDDEQLRSRDLALAALSEALGWADAIDSTVVAACFPCLQRRWCCYWLPQGSPSDTLPTRTRHQRSARRGVLHDYLTPAAPTDRPRRTINHCSLARSPQ